MLTVSAGFLNGFFGVYQSLLVPTMVGYYKLSASLSSVPNVLGGVFSLLMVFLLPRLAGSAAKERYGVIGAVCLVLSGLLAAADLGAIFFSIGFGFLILASALYGIFFRARRIELIPGAQLAQGIGATGTILGLFAPMSGLVTVFTKSHSPLAVICISGVISAAILLVGMKLTGSLDGEARVEPALRCGSD